MRRLRLRRHRAEKVCHSERSEESSRRHERIFRKRISQWIFRAASGHHYFFGGTTLLPEGRADCHAIIRHVPASLRQTER